jgi:hypothetical protein
MPYSLNGSFLWDEEKGEHFFLLPLNQPLGPPSQGQTPNHVRYRVEARPEGYFVLIPLKQH